LLVQVVPNNSYKPSSTVHLRTCTNSVILSFRCQYGCLKASRNHSLSYLVHRRSLIALASLRHCNVYVNFKQKVVFYLILWYNTYVNKSNILLLLKYLTEIFLLVSLFLKYFIEWKLFYFWCLEVQN